MFTDTVFQSLFYFYFCLFSRSLISFFFHCVELHTEFKFLITLCPLFGSHQILINIYNSQFNCFYIIYVYLFVQNRANSLSISLLSQIYSWLVFNSSFFIFIFVFFLLFFSSAFAVCFGVDLSH